MQGDRRSGVGDGREGLEDWDKAEEEGKPGVKETESWLMNKRKVGEGEAHMSFHTVVW